MFQYTSQIVEESSVFRLLFLEYDFMIVNLVRLNIAVLKIYICQCDDQTFY